MRELQSSDRNEIEIKDSRSGGSILLYYRNPTPEEQASYQARMIKRKGNKVQLNLYPTRLEFGLKVITGFRPGDFGLGGKPISSDPSAENYREDWKEVLRAGAHDIVTTFGRAVFENASVEEGIEIEEADVLEEEAVPLGQS